MADSTQTDPGPLAPLNTAPILTGGSTFYPSELHSIGHMVTFRAIKTTQLSKTTNGTTSSLGSVSLPVPANLGTTYQIDYGEQELGAVKQTLVDALGGPDQKQALGDIATLGGGALLGAGVGALMGTSKIIAAIAGMAGAAAASALTGGTAGSAAVSELIGQAGDVGQASAAQFGVARNPHRVVLFNSVGFRVHQYSYTFIPQNRKESDTLRSIIHFFKYHSAPSMSGAKQIAVPFGKKIEITAGKHFFDYPEYFQIEYSNRDYLFTIGPSFLTSVGVEYQPSGPAYTRDADNPSSAPAPYAITLQLQFKETEIVTKENIGSSPYIQGR